jgi:two-component system NtrC family response regulator
VAEDKPTLLIVEDDPGLQKQLKWCFDEYEVIGVADRPAAIAAVRRHEPAVVLQDLGLPPDPEGVSEGMQTLLETLKIAPATKVIVVTGQLDKQNAVRSPWTPTSSSCWSSEHSRSTTSSRRTARWSDSTA